MLAKPLVFPAMILIHLVAPNDRSGNARAGWLALSPSPVAFWADGPNGYLNCPPSLRQAALFCTTVHVSWAELKRLITDLPSPLFWDGVKLPG